MIFAHDIPEGGKLYFGKKAKLKREIEHIASEVFENLEYEEIVSPYFSYHQLEALSEKELIRCTDKENRTLSLRGDSSIDVIRLVIKRLKSEAKKWFYIQPVFRAPSTEIYQIGAEWLEGDIKDIINTNLAILNRLNKNYPLIISHIKIPYIASELSGVDIEDIKRMRIDKFDTLLKNLLNFNKNSNIKDFPIEIRSYLEEIKEISSGVENVIFAPLTVANLRYYDGIFYKILNKNDLIAKGGSYKVDEIRSVGFSIYTDNLLKDING